MSSSANHGRSWNPQQEEQLLELLRQNISPSEIAQRMGRSIRAIKMRTEVIARRLLDENMEEKDVIIKTKLTQSSVHELVKDRAFNLLESKSPANVLQATGISASELYQLKSDLDESNMEELRGILLDMTNHVALILLRRLSRKIRQYKHFCLSNKRETEDIENWRQWANSKNLPPYVINFVEETIDMVMTETDYR